MKLSIIDIGTQSVKHYIFEQNNLERRLVYYKRYSEANLGEHHEIISNETINRNVEIIKNCLEFNTKESVEKLHLIGTEILRKASNAKDFIDVVYKISGLDIEVISHDKEAIYLYEGLLEVIPSDKRFGAINIGGGSTELIIGTKTEFLNSIKFPFGVKNILKSFGEHDSIDWVLLDEFLDKEINISEKVSDLFITGDLDYILAMRPYILLNSSPSQLLDHPIYLNMDDWRDWILKLRNTPLNILKEYYSKNPNFCDGITVGFSVYYAIAKKLGVEKIFPSNRDLTDGVIYEMNK